MAITVMVKKFDCNYYNGKNLMLKYYKNPELEESEHNKLTAWFPANTISADIRQLKTALTNKC